MSTKTKGGLPRWAWVLIAVVVAGPIGLATLAIVGAVAIPKLMAARMEANQVRTYGDLARLARGVELYALEHDEYPDDLRALLRPGFDGAPYVPEGSELRDLWGRPYLLAQPGEYAECGLVYSLGRDGEPGGELDDADLVLELDG